MTASGWFFLATLVTATFAVSTWFFLVLFVFALLCAAVDA